MAGKLSLSDGSIVLRAYWRLVYDPVSRTCRIPLSTAKSLGQSISKVREPMRSVDGSETCFWVHLARSIRGQTSHTWLASAWFKLWVFGSVVGIVTLFMVAVPFSDNPQQIETVSLIHHARSSLMAECLLRRDNLHPLIHHLVFLCDFAIPNPH